MGAFAAEFRSSRDADPRPYLRQVSGPERAELAALIDNFLATASSPPFDPAAFAAFRADPARTALVDELLETPSGLIELRRAAGLTKAQLGRQLASDRGLVGREGAAKAAYHDIETGQVAPDRIRPWVLEVLARVLDSSAGQIRAAVQIAFETREPGEGLVFTRPGAADAPSAPGDPVVDDADVRRAFFVE